MLDTTWSLFYKYVTSIPTLIIHGIGIPLGFTFSLMEDEEIYLDFFTIFQNAFGFAKTQYIKVAESDQGGPLKTAVEKLGMRHIFCLRHLLVSL